jgi:hypothetical protein
LSEIGGGLLRLGKAFLGLVVSETGSNFAPALGVLFLHYGFPGVKITILETPVDASSISIDNVNNVKRVGGVGVPLHNDDNLDELGTNLRRRCLHWSSQVPAEQPC